MEKRNLPKVFGEEGEVSRKSNAEKEAENARIAKTVVENIIKAVTERIHNLNFVIVEHQKKLTEMMEERDKEKNYLIAIYQHGVKAITGEVK